MILSDMIRVQRDPIAKILIGSTAGAAQLNAQEVRQSGNCMVYTVDFKSERYLIKAFDHGAPESQKSWEREVSCQLALRGSKLIPAIVGHSQSDLIVVSMWQDGQDLRSVLSGDNLQEIASGIGSWYRNYADVMYTCDANTNWHDYLANYSAQGLDQDFSSFLNLFQSVKIDKLSISKNDAHLSNFILSPAQKLIGIDFAEASLKPAGWDILLTARVLRKMFPEKPDTFISTLVQCWLPNESEAVLSDFTNVAKIFAKRTAFKEMKNL